MIGTNDNFRHKGLRRILVNELREKGINDESVLAAIEKIPRHLFLDSTFLNHAYENKAFPIGAGQTISHPFTVAFQSQLLQIKKNDKVLEIGTGSGYQTVVLCELGAKVFSIERQKTLFDKTRPFLESLNYKAKLIYGDGYIGLESFAPFDKIIVTAGAPFIPEPLKKQLKVGGMLVIPVGENETQKMFSLLKKSDTEFEVVEYGDFKFVPLLEKKAN
ncbi:MAG: protein-L-isoaspartate(D-aspartate) O-methyltransferase [Bacteroidota bacterium]